MHTKVYGIYLLRKKIMLSELGLYITFAYKSGGETKTVFTGGWISKAQKYFISSEEPGLIRKFFINL